MVLRYGTCRHTHQASNEAICFFVLINHPSTRSLLEPTKRLWNANANERPLPGIQLLVPGASSLGLVRHCAHVSNSTPAH